MTEHIINVSKKNGFTNGVDANTGDTIKFVPVQDADESYPPSPYSFLVIAISEGANPADLFGSNDAHKEARVTFEEGTRTESKTVMASAAERLIFQLKPEWDGFIGRPCETTAGTINVGSGGGIREHG